MIEASKNESFPITVSLYNESTGQLVSGGLVTYDIRSIDDAVLVPPVSGTLSESSVESGIYKAEVNIHSSGAYICYASCDGYMAGTEDILISEENIYEVLRYNLPHNISVTDVVRDTVSGTVSQLNRNVALGDTDYIITKVKADASLDWGSPVASGTTFAWYDSLDTNLPYMMGGEY